MGGVGRSGGVAPNPLSLQITKKIKKLTKEIILTIV
jgi:hypothetical protein